MQKKLLASILVPIVLLILGQICMAKSDTSSLIKWETDIQQAFQKSKSEKKPVLAIFSTDWCGYCKLLKEKTLTNKDVATFIQNACIAAQIDITKNKNLAQQYKVVGVPVIVVMDDKGKELGRIQGYLPPEKCLSELQKIVKYPQVSSVK